MCLPIGIRPIQVINAEIEHETGLEVIDMPKIEEFYIGLRFNA